MKDKKKEQFRISPSKSEVIRTYFRSSIPIFINTKERSYKGSLSSLPEYILLT